MHDDGLSYSAINTAKSMLSTVFSILHKRDIGREQLIVQFMKGIYNIRPSISKVNYTWDVKVVLEFLGSLNDAKIKLKMLTVKLALLLILVTGQRCQTLFLLNMNNLELKEHSLKIRIGDLLKQSKPTQHLAEIYIECFKDNENICPVHILSKYLEVTSSFRNTEKLFVITQKPYSAATQSTIAGWIKLGLRMAGIDMTVFSPHSTRSASTSAAQDRVPIDTIIKTAGWAKDCTFRKYYQRPITNDSSFSHAILKSISK